MSANFCTHLRSLALNCAHLRSFAPDLRRICAQSANERKIILIKSPTFALTCAYLRSVTFCAHLRSFALTCAHLRSLALSAISIIFESNLGQINKFFIIFALSCDQFSSFALSFSLLEDICAYFAFGRKDLLNPLFRHILSAKCY